MNRCSICHTLIRAEEPTHICPECQQQYHESCWDGIGGCATYGCTSVAPAQKPEVPVVVGAGWGDTKTCPSCGASIGSSLLVCGCGASFPYADPLTRQEYDQWVAKQDAIRKSRLTLIGLFVLALVGIPAPVVGPIAGWYAYSKRKELEGTGGTYLAMGYGTAALGGTYAVIWLLLLLGF